MSKIQHFNIEMSINDKRTIKGFELDNKIKLIFISDPDINVSSCSIAVGAGYLQDEYPGTAHFLEHLLFMGSEKYPEQNDYHSYIQINGGQDNAFTSDNITCYYLVLETSFLKKGIEMLSWFFRAPLLNESHIESEMEIIDSEHNKNILDDEWIMDDIFKNFIKNDSKYKNFGTGNLKSLDGIQKKNIMDFYNKYYTTDNLYVCVVDSKNIEQMITEYLLYFEEIPIKVYNGSDRFQKDNLELINENLIIFNSSSDYLICNFYLIFKIDEKNLIEYQLLYFISYLIGTEYYNSFAFYLKEKDIAKNISSSVEYLFDYSAVINVRLIMVNNNIDKILESYYIILNLLEQIINIPKSKFIDIYNNFIKIKTLKLLYDSTSDPVSISNYVTENMIKGNLSESIIRNNKVPEYNDSIYEKFIEIVKNITIKISSNINFMNIPKSNFIESKWYLSSYYIDNLIENNAKIKELCNITFDFNNIIAIENFLVKNNLSYISDKSCIPQLIHKSEKLCREVYLLEVNKYNKPIGSISIIRKNELLLNKYNKILMNIYEDICYKILNYYLETIADYKLTFNMSVHKDCLIYNFMGIDYELNSFIIQITSKIYPDVVLYNNKKSKEYFDKIIRDIKEYINNLKYNSPYTICSKYLSYLLDNNLTSEEINNYIDKLTWDYFVVEINKCLKYTYEYYLFVGIKKYGYRIEILSKDDYEFNNDNYIKDIIESLELNPNKYLFNINIDSSLNIDTSTEQNIFKNYTIEQFDKNPNEINNCLIRYWICGNKINLIYDSNLKNKLDINVTKQIIKSKLIMEFISEIINEPLIDKIRTIDKLGYIVKADYKIISPLYNSLYFIIIYLVQSSYSIERISESIINFNKFMVKDIKTNYDTYSEKFKLLKKSKLIDLKKNFSNLTEELNAYLSSIVSKNFIFNINVLYWDICSEITFSDDIEPIIHQIIKPKSKYYDIIYEKN